MEPIHITVYGAEIKCASCVNLPSAKETMEWLEAALNRKYSDKNIVMNYCDIYTPATAEEKQYAEKILDDEYFYPLVVLNGEVVAEGNPKLKVIYQKIEQLSS
ncbi:YuzD family protein [Evansella halocellulosilytica]|uniref:YuzD family protein n=1 Tax=Evansella halocellulosilytica TaxID=2011013 RepID=UPI000BB757AB|nr:YuzD family protein [Evansella halocellulosilytica]